MLNQDTISADRPIMLSGASTIPARIPSDQRPALSRGDVGRGVRNGWNTIAIPLMWIAAVSIVLATIVLVSPVPPLIESDYAYLLTAADRLVDGHGLTTTPPLAPNQAWDWQGDWTFLTKWPVGYPLLVAGLRTISGTSLLESARWISVIACAVALVGWFMWMLRLVPSGLSRYILAAAGAGLSLPIAWLINPSTDLIVVAAIPWLMMATLRASSDIGDMRKNSSQSMLFLTLVGVAAGSLVWFRYAGVFVPLALGSYLLHGWLTRKGTRVAHVLAFGVGSTVPIATLFIVNTLLGSGESTRSQLNLGDRVGFDFSFALLARAWWMFTDLGYYAHREIAHWTFAAWSIALAAGTIAIRPLRQSAKDFLAKPAVALSVAVAVSLLTMLIVAKALFSGKFDYVGLDRYYQPIKPLYLALFVAPIVAHCGKWLRASACVGLLLACTWTVEQDWTKTYTRWNKANRTTTPSRSWSKCFEPGAGELYGWLASNQNESLIVASNFHEFVAFETKIPVIPTPLDRIMLEKWIARIRESRNVDQVRVVFALDPSNRWRDYWLEAPEDVIKRFGLIPIPNTPPAIAPYLFELSERVVSANRP